MYLFIVFFLCLASQFSCNSRLGRFNSRLARSKFPFSSSRGIRCRGLNLLAVLTADRRWSEENRKNSRLSGKNREGWRGLFAVGDAGFEFLQPDLGGGVRGSAPVTAR